MEFTLTDLLKFYWKVSVALIKRRNYCIVCRHHEIAHARRFAIVPLIKYGAIKGFLCFKMDYLAVIILARFFAICRHDMRSIA